METAYIASHGLGISNRYFVTPKDVTLYFYGKPATYTMRTNGIGVLSVGGFKAVKASHVIPPETRTKNLDMTGFDSLGNLHHLAVAGSSQMDGALYMVGLEVKPEFSSRGRLTLDGLPESNLENMVNELLSRNPSLTTMHFLACQPYSGRDGFTVALGGIEEHTLEDEQRRGADNRYNFSKEDRRFIPEMLRKADQEQDSVYERDRLRKYEALPQVTKSALSGIMLDRQAKEYTDFGPAWGHLTNPKQWESHKSAWMFMPRELWDPALVLPGTVNQAIENETWRWAFWLYAHTFLKSGTDKARVDLLIMSQNWLDPSNKVNFATEGGAFLTCDETTDAELVAFALGQRAVQPDVNPALVAGIEEHGARCAMLRLIPHCSGSTIGNHLFGLAPGDLEWIVAEGRNKHPNPSAPDATEDYVNHLATRGDVNEVLASMSTLALELAEVQRKAQRDAVHTLQVVLGGLLQPVWDKFRARRQAMVEQATSANT
ncbi:hypothetical protein [Streptomyces sp. NPDC086023]|uniref:hypothetical protein n=1 Tax=Streptomyces sp. NPDC086023 TaxID=3365746 RepID=UPI0037D8DBF5